MHGPYPGELRTRVIDFVEEGGSRREAAEQFDVSVSSAIRWVQRFRENGTFEPMPIGEIFAIGEALAANLALISEQPDLTLDEVVSHSGGFQEAGAHSLGSLLAMALLSKKSLSAAERKRADVARARQRWVREQGLLDPARLVFIRRNCSHRQHGAPQRLERARRALGGDVPMGHWETVTFIAGFRQTGIVAPMLIKGAMNGEAFLAYIREMSGPHAQA